MSTLAIDAGNTRVKWGVHDGTRWLRRSAVPTTDVEQLTGVLNEASRLERVVIANVAGPRVGQALAQALASAGAEIVWVQSRREQCGVRSGYADAPQLGPDRWAALIGARQLYSGPCVIANAGTTMTVDALSADSIFLGGFIVPGYSMMREALASRTAQLGLPEGAFSFFPDNTGDAIVSGALNALAGAIDRMCWYIVQSGEDEPLVVLSGGNADLLGQRLDPRPQVVDDLVLEGLVCIGASDGRT
jgi:type III pantothenate kinase